MPTQRDDVLVDNPILDHSISRPHATCPPEDECQTIPNDRPTVNDPQLPSSDSSQSTTSSNNPNASAIRTINPAISAPRDTPSPIAIPEKDGTKTIIPMQSPPLSSSFAPMLHSPIFYEPKPPSAFASSFLRNGSQFIGTQRSDKQQYKVHVDIKHVDIAESFMCGYLRIEGLTENHPTLTTYFEGEMIGTKYTFITQHPDWGSNQKIDQHHWQRFPAFRPMQQQAKNGNFTYKNFHEKEHIFMRWKEYFLVPDHRVRSISGASFEGFYYICFNQRSGQIHGIYFHAKSEKYQALELEHVPDRGCLGSVDIR